MDGFTYRGSQCIVKGMLGQVSVSLECSGSPWETTRSLSLYHQASEAQQSELTQAVLTVELLLKMHGYLLCTKGPFVTFPESQTWSQSTVVLPV